MRERILKLCSAIFKWLLDFFYPPKCVFCNVIMEVREDKFYVCADCLKEVSFCAEQHCCALCGSPMNNTEQQYCRSCSYNRRKHVPIYYDKIVGVAEYNEASKEGIYGLKSAKRADSPDTFAILIHGMLLTKLERVKFDLTVAVPPSRKRMIDLGYDQCAPIAKRLSALNGSEFVANCFERTCETKPQKTLNLEQRLSALSGTFRLKTSTETVRGKTVLVIDDVVTTGSTLNECARVLKEAGAKRVYCAVIAVTPEPSSRNNDNN